MKFTSVVALISVSVMAVNARPAETNAHRMARGLPPRAPARRATGVDTARRSTSSGISYSCNSGPVQCCNSITHSNDVTATTLASALSLVLPANTAIGLTCSPLSVIGIGGNSCSSQPVCCENNEFNGLINIGCSPITINL